MMISETRHKTYICVRGNELDSYGHVNNSVYLQYLEQGRWEFMRDNGLLENINDNNLMLVIIETTIKYLRESLMFDELVVETACERKDPFLIFKHRIINTDTKLSVARATVKTIFLDKSRKPVDIPGFVGEIIK